MVQLALTLSLAVEQPENPGPAVTIYAISTVIRIMSPTGAVSVERLDRAGDKIELPVPGRFIDLASLGYSLEPGGIYALRSNKHSLIFKVDAFASTKGKSVIERLIRF